MIFLFVPCVGDSMSRESICGDGPGVGLGIRQRPWWSEIMRDTKARVDAHGWRRFHMAYNGVIVCVWDAESNLEGVQIWYDLLCKVCFLY